MANPFVHVELNTTDVARAKAFYDQLFAWKMHDMPVENGVEAWPVMKRERGNTGANR